MAAPTRRATLGALAGVMIGAPLYRSTGPDLTFAAEEWLRDARALGMMFILGPDGHPWRVVPWTCDEDLAEARRRHEVKFHGRPRLERAVYAAVEQGFIA